MTNVLKLFNSSCFRVDMAGPVTQLEQVNWKYQSRHGWPGHTAWILQLKISGSILAMTSRSFFSAILHSGRPPSCRNKIPWLFPDQIQFFTAQNTEVLRPICLLAADKWQIPFTSSLKCTSLILYMKQIKSLHSFLAQNVLNLSSFHSFELAKRARENVNTLFTFQVVKISATTHI